MDLSNTPANQIVIGIDFGTTYSGVSWALAAVSKDPWVINDWPHPHGLLANNNKVPTAIAYDDLGKVTKWGYEVGISDSNAFRWIKILLDPSHNYFNKTPNAQEILRSLVRLEKTVEDVVTDYLRCIWDFTIDHLKRRKGDDLQELYSLNVVLTVPAVWSALAKDRTLRAAKRAGLPRNSQLVTEPEAAALAVLRQKSEEQTVKVGDGFVVCDAGGGTVDLISYKIESLEPLKVRECVVGDGALCGSVFLDLAFGQYIRTLVGRDIYAGIKLKDKNRMSFEFESGIKRSFRQDTTSSITVDLRGVGEDPEHGIYDDDTIQIKPNTLRAIFDSICGEVQGLVENQLEGINRAGLTAKAIALVGGFGESRYLYNYLKTANSGDGITVLQEPGGISAVCRGATLWGLEQKHVTSFLSRIARISYGVTVSDIFDSKIHRETDRVWVEAKKRYYAAGQISWLLKRGDEVLEGQILKAPVLDFQEVCDKDERDWTKKVSLWYSDADVAPQRHDHPSVKRLCTMTCHLPHSELRRQPKYFVKGKAYRDIPLSLEILCGPATLEFRMEYKGTLRNSVEAEYIDNF